MKHCRSILLLAASVTILLIAIAATIPPASVQDQANVAFRWAFGALVGPGANKKLVAITRDTLLKTGDEIKMVVNVTKDCFVYVIAQNPKGELSLLFPYEFRQFTTDYTPGKNYYIPKGRPWFALDGNTGRETFFLLASADRLLQLEAAVSTYLEAEAERKAELAEKVIAEIRDVRKRYRSFQTLAERPIAIGGNVRGTTPTADAQRRPDVADLAIEITANNFYARTFSIEHQ